MPWRHRADILPVPEDVMAALVLDAEAIDYPTYEEWADNSGHDRDSREGEKVYQACLATGLRLRAGIGDAGLQSLRKACEGY